MDEDMDIKPADFSDQKLIDLLSVHVTTARAATALGSAHALDLEGLKSPDIDFWTLWEGEALLGVGALKQLTPDHGEVKSMHTVENARGRGVGTLMLRHLIEQARLKGMTRLSLETGSWDYFIPARALYAMHGFAECPPFGDYRPDPNSVFMAIKLESNNEA